MSEDRDAGMDEVRRMWEEEIGMDLSHLTDEEVVDYAARWALIETPEDIEQYEYTRREAKAEAEYRDKWRAKLADRLGISRGALKAAIETVESEISNEALRQIRERNLPDPSEVEEE